jgi:hypothetical protein
VARDAGRVELDVMIGAGGQAMGVVWLVAGIACAVSISWLAYVLTRTRGSHRGLGTTPGQQLDEAEFLTHTKRPVV